jgi:hypothetical protein
MSDGGERRGGEGFWTRLLGFLDDPHGILGFAVVGGVLVSYLTLDPSRGGYLFSPSLPLEVLGHLWLLLGPPFGVALAVRHYRAGGTGLLPLVTVPLGGFLTLAGFGGVLLGLLLAALG